MIIQFRQGIISYDTSTTPFTASASPGGVDVTLNVGTQPFVVSVANLTSNYLWSESLTTDAWPNLSPTGTYWLYLDWNSQTFARTFGTSTLQPINQSTAPVSPATGQHWFNTATAQMQYWTGSVWAPVIRLFVAKFVAPSTFQSISINAPGSFQGTTVGNTTTNVAAGMVVFDSSGYPIFKHDGTFFTTEDQVFAEGSAITGVRLESNVFTAQSASASIIPVYEAVGFNPNGQIYIAGYNDTGITAIGLALQQINFGGTGAVLLEGTVTNPLWNFTGNVGGLLWVSGSSPGTLQATDPYVDDPVAFPVQHVPVGRIISPTTIIFLQGIGSKGDPGPSGSAAVPLATSTTPGTVYLSTDGGALSVPTAVVVSEIDPRLTNARTPLPHNQAATTITVTPYTSSVSGISFSGPYAQNALQQISDSALALAGGTMTGNLILNTDPTLPLQAATKEYVDNLVNSGEYLPLAGGTMTGVISMGSVGNGNTFNYYNITNLADPILQRDAVNLETLNNTIAGALNSYLPLAGGTMSGDINMGFNSGYSTSEYRITNMHDPVVPQDAATKNYVDTAIADLDIPYDMAFFVAGNMVSASQQVGAYIASRQISIVAGALGSVAACAVAPATNVTYNINQNGATIGTVYFPATFTTGTVTTTAAVTLQVGDILTVVTPTSVEPNIQNVYITIVGTAIA